MTKLNKKVALVTGGSRGIWRSDCEAIGRGWNKSCHHVREGRQRGFRRGQSD
jgi:NAD(P)-dependent dehydrogenase (short-subunit alcohol dehydrogenase family)